MPGDPVVFLCFAWGGTRLFFLGPLCRATYKALKIIVFPACFCKRISVLTQKESDLPPQKPRTSGILSGLPYANLQRTLHFPPLLPLMQGSLLMAGSRWAVKRRLRRRSGSGPHPDTEKRGGRCRPPRGPVCLFFLSAVLFPPGTEGNVSRYGSLNKLKHCA